MIEIRELIVKVSVTERPDFNGASGEQINKEELIDTCVREVMKKLERKKKR